MGRTHIHVKHGCLYGGGHLQFPNMLILVLCMCAWMHMHAHMSGDTPIPPDAPTHLPPHPEPQEAQINKIHMSWTYQDNSILFKNSLPLNTPELI